MNYHSYVINLSLQNAPITNHNMNSLIIDSTEKSLRLYATLVATLMVVPNNTGVQLYYIYYPF